MLWFVTTKRSPQIKYYSCMSLYIKDFSSLSNIKIFCSYLLSRKCKYVVNLEAFIKYRNMESVLPQCISFE